MRCIIQATYEDSRYLDILDKHFEISKQEIKVWNKTETIYYIDLEVADIIKLKDLVNEKLIILSKEKFCCFDETKEQLRNYDYLLEIYNGYRE